MLTCPDRLPQVRLGVLVRADVGVPGRRLVGDGRGGWVAHASRMPWVPARLVQTMWRPVCAGGLVAMGVALAVTHVGVRRGPDAAGPAVAPAASATGPPGPARLDPWPAVFAPASRPAVPPVGSSAPVPQVPSPLPVVSAPLPALPALPRPAPDDSDRTVVLDDAPVPPLPRRSAATTPASGAPGAEPAVTPVRRAPPRVSTRESPRPLAPPEAHAPDRPARPGPASPRTGARRPVPSDDRDDRDDGGVAASHPTRPARPDLLVAIPDGQSIVVPGARGLPETVRVGARLPSGATLLRVDRAAGLAETDRGVLRLE